MATTTKKRTSTSENVPHSSFFTGFDAPDSFLLACALLKTHANDTTSNELNDTFANQPQPK